MAHVCGCDSCKIVGFAPSLIVDGGFDKYIGRSDEESVSRFVEVHSSLNI